MHVHKIHQNFLNCRKLLFYCDFKIAEQVDRIFLSCSFCNSQTRVFSDKLSWITHNTFHAGKSSHPISWPCLFMVTSPVAKMNSCAYLYQSQVFNIVMDKSIQTKGKMSTSFLNHTHNSTDQKKGTNTLPTESLQYHCLSVLTSHRYGTVHILIKLNWQRYPQILCSLSWQSFWILPHLVNVQYLSPTPTNQKYDLTLCGSQTVMVFLNIANTTQNLT